MTFKEQLSKLGFDSYDDYLRGEHWAAFKCAYRESCRPLKCRVCGSLKIEFHHINYDRLGNETLDDVVPLCGLHHEMVHDWLTTHHKFVQKSWKAIRELKASLPKPKQNSTQNPGGKKRKHKQEKDLKKIAAFLAPYQRDPKFRLDEVYKSPHGKALKFAMNKSDFVEAAKVVEEAKLYVHLYVPPRLTRKDRLKLKKIAKAKLKKERPPELQGYRVFDWRNPSRPIGSKRNSKSRR
jgi:hypothetical protein